MKLKSISYALCFCISIFCASLTMVLAATEGYGQNLKEEHKEFRGQASRIDVIGS